MALNLIVLIIFGCLSGSHAGGDFHWSYEGAGAPQHWANHYPDCNSGSQSPIDIPSNSANYDQGLSPLTFGGYDSTSATYTMHNNGHTVQVDVSGGSQQITGGKLPRPYKLAQFHFHWGTTNGVGSEHKLNGDQFPMEMHLVHYSSRYSDIGSAADKPYGLAVVGLFFEVGSAKNDAFEKIVSKLQDVRNKGDTPTRIASFPLQDLLPQFRDDYFRYQGSLTTPGCFESVIWTVLNSRIKISQEQMNAFRNSLFEEEGGHAIADNFRPVQPLKGRSVYTNIKSLSGAANQLQVPQYITFIVSLLLAKIFM